MTSCVKQMLLANRPYSVLLLIQLNYDSIGWNKNQALFAKIFKKFFRGWPERLCRRVGKAGEGWELKVIVAFFFIGVLL